MIYAARALTLTRTLEKKCTVIYIVVFFGMTSCSLVGSYLRFGRIYHTSTWKDSDTTNVIF
jgi:hypothetical protein